MRASKLLSLYQNLDDDQKLTFLHAEREKVSIKLLASEPLNFTHYLQLAAICYGLGYSDLAAGEAYKALTLLETYFDPDFSDFHPELRNVAGEVVPWPEDDDAILHARIDIAQCLRLLVIALTDLGCLRDACTYLKQLEKLDPEGRFSGKEECQKLHDSIQYAQSSWSGEVDGSGEFLKRKSQPSRLRNFGFARREVYTRNNHELDRSSSAIIAALNQMLKVVASDIEVRPVKLPVLEDHSKPKLVPSGANGKDPAVRLSKKAISPTTLQLGLFAKIDIPASSRILQETSVLTAVRPVHASLCHNCGVTTQEPSSCLEPVCCPSCADAAVFCSNSCLEIAQSKYHSTTCGNEEIDPIGRHENSENPSEDLYFLLLARAFAMSNSQNVHPLELEETKYLWGEFSQNFRSKDKCPRTLPFTFQHNIVLPFRLLSILSEEHPEMSPFSAKGRDWYDTWVVQTLYAKFRGVASARQSTWDGKPEVAAVHPLWSLANHSCAPNVGWGWGSKRVFRVRDRPVLWGDREGTSTDNWKGIKAGEQILSHYCDVDLSVRDRREYMLGSLGGECMCERCLWEAECDRSTKITSE
jgi:hypothetical protein